MRLEDWVFEPEPGFFGEMIRSPLSLLAIPYLLAVQARIWAFQAGIFKSHQLKIPVISIGNLTLGGAGKTPTAIWLAQKLQEKGLKPAISLRGYRSQAERGLTVLNGDSENRFHSGQVGDEALMIARRLKSVPVIVGKDRRRAGEKAQELGAQILILDDGFQHLKLKRDLDLVLIDGTRLLRKEKIFPRGKLREPLWSLKRAQLIFIRAGEMAEINSGQVKQLNPNCPIFQMRYQVLELEQWVKKKAFAFAGIAEPEQFFQLAESLRIQLVGKKAFSDHHQYSAEEIQTLEAEAKQTGAEILLTTEKDLVRLKEFKTEIPLHALRIGLDFFGKEEEVLQLILEKIQEGKNVEGA